MTRIVGGSAKGRRLAVPTRGTRPTSERAREALFNTLRGLVEIDGARVLDLFAGTGAVGLEALSRGAVAAEFVESERGACEIVKRNIATIGLGGVLHRRQVSPFLVTTTPDDPFDLVFADPPYAYGEAHLTVLLSTLAEGSWLAENSVVVVERAARGPEPDWPQGLGLVKQKRYGEGVLWYGRAR